MTSASRIGTRVPSLVLAFMVIVSMPETARAQGAAVSGTVTDSTDAVLPGVTVTARHEASGNVFVGVTDEAGRYQIAGMRPGVYSIIAELPGFATLTTKNLEILLGQQPAVNLRM